ncbi:MAG: bifunctional hydroxymethylpyrimidine kinase/phosphomethylpyrimidine kinase [bacterium]|jgi:hydroxymethylpyrimidine/phosphomethylpyrimidine kinase
MKGRVLNIAGSDSGGGAGIQADLKAVTALGAFGMTAITALTAQNTLGVHGVLPVPLDFLRQQIAVVLDDLGADALKTGMLADSATIDAVCDEITARAPGLPLVADPVMVAKGGHPLLVPDAAETLKRRLLPIAAVLTPNLPEAEALCGFAIQDVGAMHQAAKALLALGPKAVLLKGGHLPGDEVVDLLATGARIELFRDRRIATRHTHGTGCTLASAVAAGLAQGLSLRDSVIRARAYVRAAIASAPGYGAGHGPLNHAVTCDPGLLR